MENLTTPPSAPAGPLHSRRLPLALGVIVLLVMAWIALKETPVLGGRANDTPPSIEFTWTPIGRPELMDIRGKLRVVDDYGLDFSSYSMRIAEIEKTLDYPVPGVAGKEFEQDISFAQFAMHAVLLQKGEMTVEFRMKDDAGQEAMLSKVVKFKQYEGIPNLIVE